ncbi:NAD(P)-dependent oxidoreductase [Sporolactobacillus vineae]|uniref:NAD(P)-dependent oxidoreductase n=1 Tax=Sporolactobacillus vineae TaxID=444463 RepID=UPI000288425C|nr:NAD(P)-dependent oxidoreductase [Sporolactobacillus vineae]
MNGYPLNINLQGKNVVVAGGGPVATRRLEALLDCGARITVICPQASDRIRKWAGEQAIIWKKRCWERTDSEAAFLILAATGSEMVNAAIAASAQPNQLICTAGHAAGNCSVPAVIRRGRLTVTIATGGASPAYARELRDQLAQTLDSDIEGYLDFLASFRKQLLSKELNRELRAACLKEVLRPEYRDRQRQVRLLKALDQWIKQQAAAGR